LRQSHATIFAEFFDRAETAGTFVVATVGRTGASGQADFHGSPAHL